MCVCVRVCSWWKPFWQMWGDISLWFWFVFLWWLAMVSIFSYASRPSSFPLWKNVYSVLLLISKTYLSLMKDNFFTFHLFNIYFYLTVVPGLSHSTQDRFSCGSWTLSRSMWDLVPWPGMEPRAPALGPQSLSHWNSRKVLSSFFFFFYQVVYEVTSILLSVSINLLVLVTSIRIIQKHIIFAWRISLNMLFVNEFCLYWVISEFHPFYHWVIFYCVYTTFCLFIHFLMDTDYVCLFGYCE